MIIAKRVGTSFDVLGMDETSASISRTRDSVQITWVNAEGQLERYKKTKSATLTAGTLLAHGTGGTFKGTGDKRSSVAVLLTDWDTPAKTKQFTIGSKTYTAKLLPVKLT